MDKPKILAFAGSLRHDSYNKKLLQIAIEGAREAGGDVTYIELRDYPLPIYDQEIEDVQGLPENAKKLKALFLSHQGFLIASPEYNSAFSGLLKNTLDWVSRPSPNEKVYLECFIDKVAILMSASPGQLGGLRGLTHLRTVLGNVFTIVLPDQKCIPAADKAFTPEGRLKDEKQEAAVKKLGAKLVDFLRKGSPVSV